MKNVILIGFMGAGKTTIGKKLARMLDYEFIDSDELIELQQAMSVGQIFASRGEGYFRELERNLIQELSSWDANFVLSTGGGMPCFADNASQLKNLGSTFYLKRSPKELAHRLKNAKIERPLLHGMEEQELEQYIEAKLGEREEYYKTADFVLDRDQQDAKSILQLFQILHPDPVQRN